MSVALSVTAVGEKRVAAAVGEGNGFLQGGPLRSRCQEVWIGRIRSFGGNVTGDEQVVAAAASEGISPVGLRWITSFARPPAVTVSSPSPATIRRGT